MNNKALSLDEWTRAAMESCQKMSLSRFDGSTELPLDILYPVITQGAMEDNELMLMLDALFESMTGSGFLSQAEKVLKEKQT